jgi:acetyltransferase
VGRAVLENLRQGFRGSLYPINPKAAEILGLAAYPSLAALPFPADLAVLAVPAPFIPGLLEECGARGIRSAVILSAGFRECGAEGAALERAAREAAEAHGISFVGPNVLGIINTDPEVGLNATFARRVPKPGSISFLSQSGALGVHALEYAATHDFGLRLFASLGNKAVVNENQILETMAADPETKVILAYLEDLKAPGEFLEKAAAIASGPSPKPVVLLKAGTGRSGSRAASSHTGAIAGKADFLGDLCAQYGVARAASLEDMFNLARCLSEQPLPPGPRLGVVTNAGGPAILAADEAERQGLALPEPSPALRARLAAALPPAAGLGNPVDALGDADPERYRIALDTLAASGEVDAVLAICTPQRVTAMEGMAAAVAGTAGAARSRGLPVLASLAANSEDKPAAAILDRARVPDYRFPENAARALGAAWRHSHWRRTERRFPTRPPADSEAVRAVLQRVRRERRTNLTEPESDEVLRAYGLPVAESFLAVSPEALGQASRTLGFPLVAKIVSPDIVHKVDAGGVRTGIEDAAELERAYHALLADAGRFRPGARIDGVLVQATVRGGTEFLIGAQRHPLYGPLLLFGLGGTLVEVIHDVRFGRAPLAESDAEGMIRGIRAAAVLDAFRGSPPRDVEALKDILFRLSWIMEDFPEILEADLNPVFSLERGARIADARMSLAP